MNNRWTFAGDESGDVSLRFERGASRYFVAAIVGTQQPDGLHQTLEIFRQRQHLPAKFEFGAHQTTSRRLRPALLETVARLDFKIWASVLDKTEIPETLKFLPPRALYVYMMTQTLVHIPLDFRQNAILTLDEFDRAGKTLADLKKALARVDIPRGFKHIRSQRSQSDALIQIADLAAGAILHHFTQQDDTAYLKFKSKIETLHKIPH